MPQYAHPSLCAKNIHLTYMMTAVNIHARNSQLNNCIYLNVTDFKAFSVDVNMRVSSWAMTTTE